MPERVGANQSRLEPGFELIGERGGVLARLLRAADRFGQSFEPVVQRQPQDHVFADRLTQGLERHRGTIGQLEAERFDARNGKPALGFEARARVRSHDMVSSCWLRLHANGEVPRMSMWKTI